MGKSAGSPPQPPNPALTAAAQSQANTSTAAAQAALNNMNQFTPYGSTTYDVTGFYTTPDGQTVPTYTQNTALSPVGQSILTGTQGVALDLLPGAQSLAQRAVTDSTKPLNFNTPYSDTLNQGPQLLNQNVTNAIYGQQKSFLDPQWNLNQKQLEDQLSRQGIPVGSEAYNSALEQLNNSRTQAYQSAQDAAIGAGTGAASNLFGMALQGQQQNIGQQQLAQSNPLQMLQSFFGAAPPSPQQPIATPSQTGVSPTNVIGAQQLSTDAANQAYQARLASQNATFGGLASLGGAGLMALALSDPRAKEIGAQTTGALDRLKAMPVSDARYAWEAPGADRPMVMADDVQRQVPGAVTGRPGGPALQMVDFARLTPLMIAGMQELARKVETRHG